MPRYSSTVKVKRKHVEGTRYHDWDKRLVNFIKDNLKKPFSWGDNDCLTFANNAVIAQRGLGFAGDHLGKYKTVKGAKSAYTRWIDKSGYTDVIAGLDAQFERVIGLPPRGSIVAMPMPDGAVFPYSFGVQVSHLAAFVTEDGLTMTVPDNFYIAWRVC